MVVLGTKEKETYLTRFECTYLATSQMTSTSQKWLRFDDLEGQSEMRKLSTLEKIVKFLQSSWEILNFSLTN